MWSHAEIREEQMAHLANGGVVRGDVVDVERVAVAIAGVDQIEVGRRRRWQIDVLGIRPALGETQAMRTGRPEVRQERIEIVDREEPAEVAPVAALHVKRFLVPILREENTERNGMNEPC